jgi:hypothetical protein
VAVRVTAGRGWMGWVRRRAKRPLGGRTIVESVTAAFPRRRPKRLPYSAAGSTPSPCKLRPAALSEVAAVGPGDAQSRLGVCGRNRGETQNRCETHCQHSIQ